MVIVAGVVASLAVGWLVGMWTRTRSDRWCPLDGSQLQCPECARAGTHVLGSPANIAPRASTVDGDAA